MKKLLTSAARVVLIQVALLITLGQPRVVFAAAPLILSFHQLDLDGDGQPDEAIIECACVTAHDQILVFDGGNDMRGAVDWQEGTDIANDTWVFDIGAEGRANLIIVFQSATGQQLARLYDDIDGDETVAYHVEGKHIIIDETPFWSLEVTARPGWFMENGQTNLNIRALLDKSFPRGFDFVNEKLARQYMPHDGQQDVEFEMVDNDGDGVAEHFLSRLLSDFPEDFDIGKSELWVNVSRKRSQRPDSALFWPFLDLQPPTGAARISLRFFDRSPSVSMDWEASSIRGFGPPGYPVEVGYWINSQNLIEKGQVNDSSYEIPHAWYDLAGNGDGIPELNIRLLMPIRQSLQEIRYSWNQVNSGKLVWDYKLGLMGDHPIDKTVDLHDFSLRLIPYEKLPYWVTGHEWKLTTFVAREGEPRPSSEGIYAWTPWSGADPVSANNPTVEAHNAALAYATGADIVPPYEYFNDIWEGFRGEYNLAQPLKPILYFSPIDRRLHLKGGEHGLLNLGNAHHVTYDNSDGDDYFDHWSFVEAGEIQRQLYVAKDYLIYTGENQVILKRADIAQSLFETLPPRNHQEWLELGRKLEQHKREFAPDDFKGMLLQFEGPETHIEGARLRDFRSTQEGFRFVLELQSGFRVSDPEMLNWDQVQSGTYVVTYNGLLSINPLTPPAPSTSLIDATLTQLELGAVQVALRNDGLEDLPQATLELWATPSGGITEVVATQNVQLLAQEPVILTLLWAPTASGTWILTPKIRQPDGRLDSGDSVPITVSPSQTANPPNLLLISTSPERLPTLLAGLMMFATLAALVLWHAWQGSVVQEGNDER